MPRKARPVLAGWTHHILYQGRDGPIFFSEEDYEKMHATVRAAKTIHHCLIYAYVFMPDHIHLLVTPRGAKDLGRMMKVVGGRYTRYINKRQGRRGALWEGRFRSSPLQAERHQPAVSRYIELDPVRSGLVEDPLHYPWSSCRARALGLDDPALDVDPWYQCLGATSDKRQMKYRTWLDEPVPTGEWEMIEEAVHRSGLTGGRAFVERMQKVTGREIVLRPRGRPRKNPLPRGSA